MDFSAASSCQRIYARDRVTQRAISVNQSIDARLQCCFASLDPASAAPLRSGRLPNSNPSKKADHPESTESGFSCKGDTFPRSHEDLRERQWMCALVI